MYLTSTLASDDVREMYLDRVICPESSTAHRVFESLSCAAACLQRERCVAFSFDEAREETERCQTHTDSSDVQCGHNVTGDVFQLVRISRDP